MAAAKIWKGFGTRVLANDVRENPSLEGVVEYVGLEELLRESPPGLAALPPAAQHIPPAECRTVRMDGLCADPSAGACLQLSEHT